MIPLDRKLSLSCQADFACPDESLGSSADNAIESIGMLRKLRIVAAYCCFVVGVGLIALWVRCYSSQIVFNYYPSDKSGFDRIHFGICLKRGVFFFAREKTWLFLGEVKSGIHEIPVDYFERLEWSTHHKFSEPFSLNSRSRFAWKKTPYSLAFCFPIWLLVVLFAACLFAFKPAPRFRFSLRELLLLTTISAVTVGGIAAMFRLAA